MSYIAIGTPAISITPGDSISIGNGAVNTVINSCLIGDPKIINIRPNSTFCDLGTTINPFNVSYMKFGQPASLTKYAQYEESTVQNSDLETSLTNDKTEKNGSTTYPPNQSIGTVIRIKMSFSIEMAVGEIIFNIDVNNLNIITSNAFTSPLGPVGGSLEANFIIAPGDLLKGSLQTFIDGRTIDVIYENNIAYDPTIENKFDITVKFDTADLGNIFTTNLITIESLYCT